MQVHKDPKRAFQVQVWEADCSWTLMPRGGHSRFGRGGSLTPGVRSRVTRACKGIWIIRAANLASTSRTLTCSRGPLPVCSHGPVFCEICKNKKG